MRKTTHISGIGAIYATLAARSSRPRYAFLVLQLVAEAANTKGIAGPFMPCGDARMTMRDWLCTQLMPMSERDGRRGALRARIVAGLADRLRGDRDYDRTLIDDAVDDHVLTVGRANVSRAILDLVGAGLVRRHYAGYATNLENRGGGRHAVYVIAPETLAALGKPVAATFRAPGWPTEQGNSSPPEPKAYPGSAGFVVVETIEAIGHIEELDGCSGDRFAGRWIILGRTH